jgi:hypothetical protein
MAEFPDTLPLDEDVRVGDTKTLSLRTFDENDNELSPTAGWFLGMDPDRSTVVTASNSAPASNRVQFRATVSGATNLWNSIAGEVTQSEVTYRTEVVSYTSGAVTGLWTLRPLGLVVASGATLRLNGYPLMARTSATLSTAKGTVTVTPSGALNEYTAYAGERRLVYGPTFAGGNEIRQVATHTVRPGW